MVAKSFLPGSSQMSGKMKKLKAKVIARKGPITSLKSPVYTSPKAGVMKSQPVSKMPMKPKLAVGNGKAKKVKMPKVY